MARPRRGKDRRSPDDGIAEYFRTGHIPGPEDVDTALAILGWSLDEECHVWAQFRDRVMSMWDLPGCRPWAWWRHDAPRLPVGTFPGCYYDGQLPEPRRHLGGPGCPAHERYSVVPTQSFGLWMWSCDGATFETQFSYLDRHGLLLPTDEPPASEPHAEPTTFTIGERK